MKKKCNQIVYLSKSTLSKKILSRVVALIYNQDSCQTLSKV